MPDPKSLTARLVAWYREHRRDLPWRRNPEPWRVLVSETMLQQTRVAAVLPKFEAFLDRFPTPKSMAEADEEAVLAQWSGLGYYRRARLLHAAAREMVERHGGRVPDERGALLELSGVGAYTAGAVLSIAFARPEPVVDGNVERVFSRLFLLTGNVKRGETRKRLWELARAAVEAGPPDEVNQGLMELGALVCLPRAPRCSACPLADACAAHEKGREEELPTLPAARSAVDVGLAVALVRDGDRVLLARHPAGDFLAGTWGPPFARIRPGESPAAALERGLPERYGLALLPGDEVGRIRHSITHHRITGIVLCARASPPLPRGATFAGPGERAGLGLSSLARKALELSRDLPPYS